MPNTIRIEGIEPLLRKISTLAELKPVKTAIKAAATHLKGKIAVYPPATIANAPGQKRWYERGYGPKWMTKGGVHGRKTSETLGRKWTIGVKNAGLTAVIGNNVSYGPYVQGEKQAWFHKRNGWKTTDDVAEQEADTVQGFVQGEIQKVIDAKQ